MCADSLTGGRPQSRSVRPIPDRVNAKPTWSHPASRSTWNGWTRRQVGAPLVDARCRGNQCGGRARALHRARTPPRHGGGHRPRAAHRARRRPVVLPAVLLHVHLRGGDGGSSCARLNRAGVAGGPPPRRPSAQRGRSAGTRNPHAHAQRARPPRANTLSPLPPARAQYDPKNRRTFLRRAKCPGVARDQLHPGATATVLARQLQIKGCADEATRRAVGARRERWAGRGPGAGDRRQARLQQPPIPAPPAATHHPPCTWRGCPRVDPMPPRPRPRSTLALVKPDAVHHAGEILDAIERAGLSVPRLAMCALSEQQARELCAAAADGGGDGGPPTCCGKVRLRRQRSRPAASAVADGVQQPRTTLS